MSNCEQCGNDYPDDSPGGICPVCLLDSALGAEEDDPDLWLALNSAPDSGSAAMDRRGEMIGPWQLGERIGEGAFGEVFRATQSSPVERIGALKIMKSGLDTPDRVSRFEAERQALARLNHPNIATIFDAGQTDEGLPWYAMELINGEPITSYCRKRNLPTKERLRIFQTICQAVDYAHENGIVHRDLKPSNLLVGETLNGPPLVKVIDFGIAKAMDDPLTKKTLFTHAGVLIGTLEYMSPEQASGKSLDLDARSDVYSLGVLLYELLTDCTPIGRFEFREAAFEESLRMIRETEADRPSTVSRQSKLASELDWITLKALEKNRDRRYLNSGELSEDIERYLSSEPVRARKTGFIYRTEKFSRRNRKAIAATTLTACLVAIAALIGSWWSAKNLAVSPALLAASEFRPAPYPGELPDSPQIRNAPILDDTTTVKNFPETVARLCQTLRDDPDDKYARFRLWAMLTLVNYPERVGAPLVFAQPVTGVALVPTHKLALAASRDGMLRVVSTKTGELLTSFDCGTPLTQLKSSRYIKSMAAAVGEDGSLFVIDLENIDTPIRIDTGQKIDVIEIAGGLDTVLCGNSSGRLSAWPIKDSTEPEWSIELGTPITHLDFYSYGNNHRLACGLADGRVRALDPTDGSALGTDLPGDGELAATGMSWRSGELLAVRQSGEDVLWDYQTAEYLRREPLEGGPVTSAIPYGRCSTAIAGMNTGETIVLGFTTDYRRRIPSGSAVTALDVGLNPDRIVATGNENGEVRTWTFEIGRPVAEPISFGKNKPIDHVAINSNPKLLIASCQNRAQLWDYSYRPTGLTHYRESGYVTDAAVIPDTDLVRFMGTGGAVDYHIDSAKLTGLPHPIPRDASTTALSGDGIWIAAAYGPTVRTWKIPAAGESIAGAELTLNSGVTTLALSPTGANVAIGTEDGEYQIFDTRNGNARLQPSGAEGQAEVSDNLAVTATAVSRKFAAFGFANGTVRVVSLQNSTEINDAFPRFSQPVDCLAISPIGTIAAGCRNGDVVLYSASEDRILSEPLQHKAGIVSLGFSSDGHWLATGTRDWYGHHWNAHDGRFLFHTHRFVGDVTLTAYSPSLDRYFQCGADNSGGATSQPFPPIDSSIPVELLDYAEAYAGLRIDENGDLSSVPFSELGSIREKIAKLPENGDRARHWLRWAASPKDQRWQIKLER